MKKIEKIKSDLIYDLVENGYIDSFTKNIENTNVLVSRTIITPSLAKKLAKKEGLYSTILFESLENDTTSLDDIINVFVKELKYLFRRMKITKKSSVLIVGLGNDKSTPDALGPLVAKNILVTRYLTKLKNITLMKNLRNVSAIIPGVTGVTGIETLDLIKSITDKTKPDLVILIDALASSSITRLNKTIQLSDTGIAPGSGVKNARKQISKETLKIPVISIGVPTVISSSTLVNETINNVFSFFEELKESDLNKKDKEKLLGMVGTISDEERQKLIYDILNRYDSNLIITTKEIDFIIDKLSQIIFEGLNKALHNNSTK